MNLMPDDLDVLAETMPSLARMRRDGMTFDRYFVTNSLCCPSRATIFTGLLPHNSGVLGNTAPDGGFVGYNKNGNPARSFAVALHDAHYATAMMGKYLNGYRRRASTAFRKAGANGRGGRTPYANYDYTINHNGDIIAPEQHMTDELSALGQAFIANASGGPFFLELSTFSPHAPYTPPQRYADAFPGLTHPRTPAFGHGQTMPRRNGSKDIPPLEDRAKKRDRRDIQTARASVMGVDDMIGAIRQTLDDLGLTSDTYVIFTSDNGYHLGEYSLQGGQEDAVRHRHPMFHRSLSDPESPPGVGMTILR